MDATVAIFDNQFLQTVGDPGRRPFKGAMAEEINNLIWYLNINASGIGFDQFGHCNKSTGSYTGIYGAVSSGLADFSANLVPLDSYDDSCGDNISMLFAHESKNNIMSAPCLQSIGFTESKNIFESFHVLDIWSYIFILAIVIIFKCLMKLFMNTILTYDRGMKSQVQYSMLILALVFYQNIPSKLPKNRSNVILISSLRFLALVVSLLTLCAMNTDLVVYEAPPLIRSMADLLNSDAIIRASGTSHGTIDYLAKSPLDSVQHQIYEIIISYGEVEEDQDSFLDYDQYMIDHNIADLGLDVAHQMFRAIHCQRRGPDGNLRSHSQLLISDSYFLAPNIFIFNSHLELKLRERVILIAHRMIEHGMHKHQFEILAAQTVSALPMLESPSIECMNSYEWEKPSNTILEVQLELFSSMFYSSLGLLVIAMLVLLFEALYHNEKEKRRMRSRRTVARQNLTLQSLEEIA